MLNHACGRGPRTAEFRFLPLIRIDQVPEVIVEIIEGGDEPGSFGEQGTMPMCSALGNAIYAATGKRIRSTPFGVNGITFV